MTNFGANGFLKIFEKQLHHHLKLVSFRFFFHHFCSVVAHFIVGHSEKIHVICHQIGMTRLISLSRQYFRADPAQDTLG